eukprot:2723271-Pleurochrysis_carterae.AAC.4
MPRSRGINCHRPRRSGREHLTQILRDHARHTGRRRGRRATRGAVRAGWAEISWLACLRTYNRWKRTPIAD